MNKNINANFDILLYVRNKSNKNNKIKIGNEILDEYYSDNCDTRKVKHDFYLVKKKSNISTNKSINYYQCQNCSVIAFE